MASQEINQRAKVLGQELLMLAFLYGLTVSVVVATMGVSEVLFSFFGRR
jgi:flagellar biosynthesis protein FliQ